MDPAVVGQDAFPDQERAFTVCGEVRLRGKVVVVRPETGEERPGDPAPESLEPGFPRQRASGDFFQLVRPAAFRLGKVDPCTALSSG